MKILIASVTAASLLVSSPAMANNFGGVYGEITAGAENITSETLVKPRAKDINYGVAAGINVPAGNIILGVEASINNVFDREEYGASARIGYAFDKVMPYVKAGYANYNDSFSRSLSGLRVGGGVEYNISEHTYIKAEYRYTDFEQGIGKHGGLVGVGIRF